MIAAAQEGTLTIDKLEAMTCVCSVGLDMIAVPGDTSAETISAIIADEAAVGMVNSKTTAVRLLPAPGKTVGDRIEMGGLSGLRPGDAGAPGVQRRLHRPGRPHPGSPPQPKELKRRERTVSIRPALSLCYVWFSARRGRLRGREGSDGVSLL